MPLVTGAVLEPTGQAALVLPVNGHPVEMNGLVISKRGATAIGIPHRADPPGAILQAEGVVPVYLQPLAVVTNPPLPGAELVQPGGIHYQVALVAHCLAPFLDTGGMGRKDQVALYAGIVSFYHHPVPPHGLKYLQGKRADRGVGRFRRRPPGSVKGILMAVDGKTQCAIEDSQVGIAAHADAKVKTAVPGMPVVPEAIIGIAIAGRGVEHGLGRLVYRVVVKFG